MLVYIRDVKGTGFCGSGGTGTEKLFFCGTGRDWDFRDSGTGKNGTKRDPAIFSLIKNYYPPVICFFLNLHPYIHRIFR